MEKDIDRIMKNPDTDIVIRIDDFGGKRGLTIREFVKSERYTGFTKAGTRIPAEQFKAFKDAINSIDEAEMLEPAEGAESAEGGEGEQKTLAEEKEAEEESPKQEGEKIEEKAI